MKLLILGLLIGCFLQCGCSQSLELAPFRSDGCSLFPDRSLISDLDWEQCCLEHDLAYWQGGTEAQRLAADLALKSCVESITNDPILAELMFQGVRLGGSPYFPTWYRWGYGWSQPRGYQALSEEEEKEVKEQLDLYFKNQP